MEEMRRKDREVTELETVKEIIRQCDVLRLGLADGDYPYIVPMNFGWEEKEGRLYFYLHGAAEGRKAELLRQNGACSFQMDCGHRVVQLPGARHYHTVRLRNGQGDCYPADRGRKAPGHAAFDRPVPARRTGLPAADHGPHRHVAAGGGRLERQGE